MSGKTDAVAKKGRMTREERIAHFNSTKGNTAAQEVAVEAFPAENAMLAAHEEQTNPMLEAPVKERDYASGGDIIVEGVVADQIDEPVFEPQRVVFDEPSATGHGGFSGDSVYNTAQPGDGGYGGGSGDGAGEDEKDPYLQDIETSNLADTIVGGLKTFYSLVAESTKLTEHHMMTQVMRGKLNPDVMESVVHFGNNAVPLVSFIKHTNDAIDEVMQLEEDKEREFKDLFKRIAKKRGAGMSDEGRVAFLVIDDIIKKGPILWSLRTTMKDVIKNQEAILENMKKPVASEMEFDATRKKAKAKAKEDADIADDIKEKGE